MSKIIYEPIGVIHSSFKNIKDTPAQSALGKNIDGTVELFEKYKDGLKNLQRFSHIFLIFHFHLVSGYSLMVKPYMDTKMSGIFSTRTPKRPNPIGISVVRIIKIEKNIIRVSDLDILDGTPLLDIKPYIPKFDSYNLEKFGI